MNIKYKIGFCPAIVFCLFIVVSTIPVMAGNTDNMLSEKISTENINSNGNNSNSNFTINETLNKEIINENIQITEEEKVKTINIAINFTVNIGIANPSVISIERDKENTKNLDVKVKDHDTGENIIIIITPNGEAKQSIINEARFTGTTNNFIGRHVSFQLTQDTIVNYNIDGKLVFQSIALGFNPTNIKRVGSELRIFDNAKHTVIIHDNDNGIITESSTDNIEAIYKVANDIKINANKGNRVDLSNNIKASILSNDPDSNDVITSVSGNTINVKINKGKSTFITKSIKEEDEFENRLIDEFSLNKIGGIINIDSENSFDVNTFDIDTTIKKISQNTVSLSVNSDIPTGKVIALRVNKDILKDLNLHILVDGDEIKQAVDFNDLFKNDKLSYLIVIGQNIEVLISIPKFSEHEIVVTSEVPTATTMGTTTTSTIPTSTGISPATTTAPPAATPSVPGLTSGLILVVILTSYILKKIKK